MIPANTVRDIMDAVRIEEVVEEFVNLRRRGVNMIGLCPFHNEKTPSFNVNPTRNIFKCFGCGKGGDAVTFLIEHEKFTYPEALRWLARKYNIEIEEVERTPEQVAEQQLTDSLYIVNDFALQHFQTQLFDTDEGKSIALAYFKQRGLREDTIRTFGLGYAPSLHDLLLQRAKAAGHSLELIKKVGLCNQEGTRDFFRGRVMFAIHNLSGKVAAFAGRTMSSDKKVPKYINSPETEIYVKNKILYGAYQAKKAIRQLDECILVEGYTDVLSLFQSGIENVVASSGTALTEGQLQLIKRNTENLKILYDGDPAGVKAALRGLDLALEQGLNVKVVLLPEGEDPDSYIQKVGSTAFGEYIDREARDFILFKTGLLMEEAKGDPIKKAGLIKDILGSIARIPDPIKRGVYLKECSSLLDVSEEVLHVETNKLIAGALRKKADRDARQPQAASDSRTGSIRPDVPMPDPEISKPAREEGPKRGDEFQERDIIRLLVQFGNQMLSDENITLAELVVADIEESLDSFDNPLYSRIAQECHSRLLAGQPVTPEFFLEHNLKEVRDLAITLLAEPTRWNYSPNWEAMKDLPLQNQPMPEFNFSSDAQKSLNLFKLRKIVKILDLNKERIRAAEQSGKLEELARLHKVHIKLQEVFKEISKRTGTIILR
ncbi:MAG: DNA primase [Bacteroidetes bacterium]|nr:MAG: DNA primase [Bacteroidota bacterium]